MFRAYLGLFVSAIQTMFFNHLQCPKWLSITNIEFGDEPLTVAKMTEYFGGNREPFRCVGGLVTLGLSAFVCIACLPWYGR